MNKPQYTYLLHMRTPDDSTHCLSGPTCETLDQAIEARTVALNALGRAKFELAIVGEIDLTDETWGLRAMAYEAFDSKGRVSVEGYKSEGKL